MTKRNKDMKTKLNITYPAVAIFAFACLALSPTAQAVLPAPDGGYPGANTAEGTNALFSLTTGTWNTGNGYEALFANTSGSFNTATGANTLRSNTTGSQNTADGVAALRNNVQGFNNTAIGVNALNRNNRSNYNTAVGHSAVVNAHDSGIGFGFNGSLNVGIGYNADSGITDGARNVCIGANVLGASHDHDTIRIGTPLPGFPPKTFIAGIRGITSVNANAIPVVIDSAGQLGTVSSSERFKKEIKPMDKASEAILALKPVTFHYKSDSTNTSQFGLIAEEVGRWTQTSSCAMRTARSTPSATTR